MTISEAWAALGAALEKFAPGCEGLDEFTSDRLDEQQTTWAESVCADCPVLAECSTYATVARPPSGFWAGRQRSGRAR